MKTWIRYTQVTSSKISYILCRPYHTFQVGEIKIITRLIPSAEAIFNSNRRTNDQTTLLQKIIFYCFKILQIVHAFETIQMPIQLEECQYNRNLKGYRKIFKSTWNIVQQEIVLLCQVLFYSLFYGLSIANGHNIVKIKSKGMKINSSKSSDYMISFLKVFHNSELLYFKGVFIHGGQLPQLTGG